MTDHIGIYHFTRLGDIYNHFTDPRTGEPGVLNAKDGPYHGSEIVSVQYVQGTNPETESCMVIVHSRRSNTDPPPTRDMYRDATSMAYGKTGNVALVMADIDRRLRRIQEEYPEGYTADRNSLRLGIASIQDELCEAHEAWDREKREPFTNLGHTYDELLDVAAVAIYVLQAFK